MSDTVGSGFTSGSTGTYFDSTGTLQTAASNIPRITYNPDGNTFVGLLIEKAATNTVVTALTSLPSGTAVSTVSLANTTAYVVSYRGIGTVTISGAVSKVITGGANANSLVTSTFTTTSAATATVTVSVANIKYLQIELGTEATSYIANNGTRTAEVINGGSSTITNNLVYSNVPDSQNLIDNVALTNNITTPQTITVVSGRVYTLSFEGTGTITPIGAYTTALVGVSVGIRNSATFTASTTSITLTSTGIVTYAQLELGTKFTTYVPKEYWASGTNYGVGTRVMYTSTTTRLHTVYECLIAGVEATFTPDISVLQALPKWLEITSCNRFAVFDGSVASSSYITGPMVYIMKAGKINSMAIFEASGAAAQVSLTIPSVGTYGTGTVVYSAETPLISGSNVTDWYQYFYDPTYEVATVASTALATIATVAMPGYGEALLTVVITPSATNALVSCGVIVPGISTDIGALQNQPTVGIIDYSRKETDVYGNVSITKRNYSKRMNIRVAFPSTKVDNIARALSTFRSTPVVWVGTESLYGVLIVYGFYKDWEISIDNPVYSSCTLQIEGLT